MAFLKNGNTVISFAEYQDVVDADTRLFETNEGLTEDVIEAHLIRATERILSLIRATTWWRSYYLKMAPDATINTVADIPELDPDLILARQADFTDLCVYYALYNYILPAIADFGTEENAERAKIGYNQQKYDGLFSELITAGDWYDFDNAGIIVSSEKLPWQVNLKRIR